MPFTLPRTKSELIRMLQRASFRDFTIYEGMSLFDLPSKEALARKGAAVIVLSPR